MQKNACFSNAQQPKRDNVTTQQPRHSPDQIFNPPGFSNQQPTPTPNNSINLNSNASSETTSPIVSSPGHNSSNSSHSEKISLSNIPKISNDQGCECSDDEADEKKTIIDNNTLPGPSGCAASKKNQSMSRDSSSFEELGAVGGDSNEKWQFIEKTSSNGVQIANDQPSQTDSSELYKSLLQPPTNSPNSEIRKFLRRRSDSYIVQMKNTPNVIDDCNEAKKLKVSCKKCGKQKNRIKQEIAKFREQLESSNQTEEEKQEQLRKFLSDLEQQSRQSMDITDSEESQASHQHGNVETVTTPSDVVDDVFGMDNEMDGIHVYGHNEEQSNSTVKRFTELEDIGSR